MTMANPLDTLLTREYSVPSSDDTRPAFIELSSRAFCSIEQASVAQIRLAAKLRRAIALRHDAQAARLEAFADERGSV
jgi:hypothetical protein